MPRIALVHDYFIQMGGAERVAEALHRLFPAAPLYTTVSLPHRLTPGLRDAAIHTSWMQRLPRVETRFRHYFMLYPWAVESLALADYDLVISSSSGYGKGVRRGPQAVHVCYCHTPMRWVWRYDDYAAREEFGAISRVTLPALLSGLRWWDRRAAQQPDHYLANSRVVAERIRRFYGREAFVIPPPIDVDRFQPDSVADDYYLVLSRLIPYKRIDLAVEACTRLGRPLVVLGDGPDRRRLESLAGPTVEFLGRVSDATVRRFASRCRALLFPGEEDFGLTPLEINAAGRPVIAWHGGGALETVIEGVTGLFFREPTSAALAEAIEEFEQYSWDQRGLRRHAEQFSFPVFAARMLDFLRRVAPASCAQELPSLNPNLSGEIQKHAVAS